MSLIRLAVRVASVKALIDRTFAGGRVYDSAATALDDLVGQDPSPFIVVTTDDGDREVAGRDLLPNSNLALVIEFAVASKTETGEMTIPHTDEGLEITLDLMERQIVRALIDEATGWSEDFKRLVPRMTRAFCRRGASAEDGLTFAARQLTLTMDTLNDPDFGVALADDHPLKIFTTRLATGTAAEAALAARIEAEAIGDAIPDWNRVRLDLGILRTAADSIRLGDYIEGEGADELEEVIATRTDRPVTHTVNETFAEEHYPSEEEE